MDTRTDLERKKPGSRDGNPNSGKDHLVGGLMCGQILSVARLAALILEFTGRIPGNVKLRPPFRQNRDNSCSIRLGHSSQVRFEADAPHLL